MLVSTKLFSSPPGNSEFIWTYGSEYQSAPVLLTSLANGSHTSGFGYPSRGKLPDSFGATLSAGNTGAQVYAAAFGTGADGQSSNLRILHGASPADGDTEILFGDGSFSDVPNVFLSLQNGSYHGEFGRTPSVKSISQTRAQIQTNNSGTILNWVAIGTGNQPNQNELKIQTMTKVLAKDEPFSWRFRQQYSSVPTLIISLVNGTYQGNIGQPSQILELDPTGAQIKPNNNGCELHCVAIGN